MQSTSEGYHYTSQQTHLHFLSEHDVEQWLRSDGASWLERFSLGSTSLIELVTNDVVKPQDLTPERFNLACSYLTRIDNELNNRDASAIELPLATIFAALATFLVEAGPYRFELQMSSSDGIDALLNSYRQLRLQATDIVLKLFGKPIFDSLRSAVTNELLPLISSMNTLYDGRDDRFMPFRLLQINAVFEQIRLMQLRLEDDPGSLLYALLSNMYSLKSIRFGTSGYRGVWGRDFNIAKTRLVTQTLCDYLLNRNMPQYLEHGVDDLHGRIIVIGYDGRKNSDLVALHVADVCLLNGFQVEFASRPTPTPVLNFYAREIVGQSNLAGLVNCTASHNPPEWQGIKFNPRQGYPAPSNLTDLIASRSNVRQLLSGEQKPPSLNDTTDNPWFRKFDPINLYLGWIQQTPNRELGDQRIALNFENIAAYFADKTIILDPMHGAGTGYLSKLLGSLGLRHISIHDERDDELGLQTELVRGVAHLEYANPEPNHIQPLIDMVEETGAQLGLGLDTDADRYGIVDSGGVYIRPNQILALLTEYLGVEKGETGRVGLTQTGLPLIDSIAREIPNNDWARPPEGTIPAYATHAFFHQRVGDPKIVRYDNTYVVNVGIKYGIDIAKIPVGSVNKATAYQAESERSLPNNYMDRLLLFGEESSGLTTRGHVPDKDGLWAGLLVMDMLAHYGLKYPDRKVTLTALWSELIDKPYAWPTFGTRLDLDTSHEIKELLLNYFLDLFKSWSEDDSVPTLAGFEVVFVGGVRFDSVEIFLQDAKYGQRHYLRIRASGTEPITRVYAESAIEDAVGALLQIVLDKLDELNVKSLENAFDVIRLADVLSNTQASDTVYHLVTDLLQRRNWQAHRLVKTLQDRIPHVDRRNAQLVNDWIDLFASQ